MKNKYFPDEEIDFNDLYFICFMVERVSRRLHQRNKYVVNSIGKDEIYHLICCAKALHCENPKQVEQDWIDYYKLTEGEFDITDVDKELAMVIPRPNQMGKVYSKLITNTMEKDENYVEGIFRIYNDRICDVIDNYNCSAFYEPSYVIARAYQAGGF